MAETDIDNASEMPSSTTAAPESQDTVLPPSTSSPKLKREYEVEDDENGKTASNKRQRIEENGVQQSKPPKHGSIKQLRLGLDWVDENPDLSEEAKACARKLRDLVCDPHKTNFRGYNTSDSTAEPSSEPSTQPSSDPVIKQEEKPNEESKNPHTNVPPPFALPDKKNFTQGPSPAVWSLNKIAPTLSTLPPVPTARMKNHTTTNNVAAPTTTTLPAAPQITNVALTMAPFMHTSVLPAYVAPTGTNSYEPLEFLGDAYLEVIATRLIHSRFPLHTVGQKAGLRELLVKNETLAEYANAYGFGERVQSSHKERHGPVWTKVLADVFEAYLACVIIQDENSDAGFLAAEKWLTELWAPKILAWRQAGDGATDTSNKTVSQTLDPKTDLNRLLTGKDSKIEYREEKEMQLIKEGNRTVFFMGVYLTGWGFTNQHLGSGEGRSKQIASTAAAEYALRNSQDVIQMAYQRKVQFERQFKKSRGGHRGGFNNSRGGRGGVGYNNRGGMGYQASPPPPQHMGFPPPILQPGYPQHPPVSQHAPPYLPPQSYGGHPAPGSWHGPRQG